MTQRMNPADLSAGRSPAPEFLFSRMESLLRGRAVRHLTVDGVPAVFVRDPVLARTVLVGESRNYGKGELFRKARTLSRVGMLSEDEAVHRHYRRLASPYLRSTKVEDYVPLMRRIVRGTVTAWKAGEAVDVQEQMCRITCAIAVETLITGLPRATTVELGERLSRLAWEMIRKPLYGKAAARTAGTAAAGRLAAARREFRDLLAQCVDGLLASPGKSAGYLSTLLTDADEQGNPLLTPEEVCEEAVMVLTAATVTTASVMSWALHTLDRHPAVEEPLLKDLARRRAEDGGHDHGPPGYTLRFLMEVLRLYPPVWISCRKTLTDVVLGEHPLPAGTNLVFSSYLLHRDPGHYPDPHRFHPDRWLTVRPSTIDASYIPFGIGSKGCIGEMFAWEQLEVILDELTREWKLTTVPGLRVRTAPETTLHPRRLLMIAHPR